MLHKGNRDNKHIRTDVMGAPEVFLQSSPDRGVVVFRLASETSLLLSILLHVSCSVLKWQILELKQGCMRPLTDLLDE